jgi:NIPSNAP protein
VGVAAQLRIYDIKPGTMEGWLELFRAKVVPMHAKFDIAVRTAWVDRERSQFVWVREFLGEGSVEEQEQRYVSSEERARVIGDEPRTFIQSMEVRVVESALET